MKTLALHDVNDQATREERTCLEQLCTDANSAFLEKVSRLAYVCKYLDRKKFAYQHTIHYDGLMIFRRHVDESVHRQALCRIR